MVRASTGRNGRRIGDDGQGPAGRWPSPCTGSRRGGMSHMSPKELFRKFARVTADVMGSAWTFCTAIVVVVVWACLGPAYDYSDTWQLVINTATTIVTFLMVFVIQNT